MKHGQKIVLKGEADQLPGTLPGDVVFVLAQKKHDTFLRKEGDLLLQKKITLVEALCGAQVLIEHLDGRKLMCSTQPGEIIKPGHVKTIDEEGMPHQRNPFVKGKLYIRFDIEFPQDGWVTPQRAQILHQALPKATPCGHPMDAEEVVMQTANLESMGQKNSGTSGYDDEGDEEMGDGRRNVQCAQQ